MNKEVLKNTLGWGAGLWFLGFALGMIFFPFVPVKYIGIPILIVIIPAIFIAGIKIFKEKSFPLKYAILVALSWFLIALALDYQILVKTFKVENYYDADIFIYYIATFVLPLIAWKKYSKK